MPENLGADRPGFSSRGMAAVLARSEQAVAGDAREGSSAPGQGPSRFKIGILIDSPICSKYVYDFVNWARSQSHLSTSLILHPSSQAEWNTSWLKRMRKVVQTLRKNGIFFTLSKVLFRGVTQVENALLTKVTRHKQHTTEFDLAGLADHTVTISPIVSKSGFVYRFSAPDVQRVKELDCDVLVRCGSGIFRGDILQAAKHGILSFHHADNRVNRGGPAGFWEVYSRQDTTGFIIQRLTEELDGGEVLSRGHFRTEFFFQLNYASLLERSTVHLKLLIQNAARTGTFPEPLPMFPYSERLFRSPNAAQVALYSARVLARFAAKSLGVLFGFRLRWQVAFLHSNWRNAVLWRAVTLKNPAFHYLADPFVIKRNGKTYCFVEDYSYLTKRGNIAVYELKEKSASRLGLAISENTHFSFPYLFEYNGQLFMCPESAEAREIRIYKCEDFPLRWRLEKVAMRDVSAADTMIFEHNGKWWMFTNIDPNESGDHCSHLFLFHSDSPFGEWTPHAQNPVIVDAARARNGGLLRDGNRLFRVAQAQGFDFYGKQTLINEIVELTEESYCEIRSGEITPNFQEGVTGTHHLHSNGMTTVFDCVRRSFIVRGAHEGSKDLYADLATVHH